MGIQIICTFIVARFLTPSDFGLVGLLIVFTVIGNTIVDSGFGQALVREKEVSDLEYSSVFYLNVFLCIFLTTLFLCWHFLQYIPPHAIMYHTPWSRFL